MRLVVKAHSSGPSGKGVACGGRFSWMASVQSDPIILLLQPISEQWMWVLLKRKQKGFLWGPCTFFFPTHFLFHWRIMSPEIGFRDSGQRVLIPSLPGCPYHYKDLFGVSRSLGASQRMGHSKQGIHLFGAMGSGYLWNSWSLFPSVPISGWNGLSTRTLRQLALKFFGQVTLGLCNGNWSWMPKHLSLVLLFIT